MEKLVLGECLARIGEAWRPKVIAELNGQVVQLVKLQGEFVWHRHEEADELFLGLAGRFRVELRERSFELGPGELLVVPRGVEHRTVADEEAAALLCEPAGTRNTGEVEDARLTAPVGVRLSAPVGARLERPS